jgi:DNA-binding CsgD family transcriptional regulator
MELQLLNAAFGRASGGDPALVLVAGEAGVGKTRLVEEFASRALRRGACVLTGGCVRLSGEMAPFAPVVEAFRRLFTQWSADELDALFGASRPGLAPLLPAFNEVIDRGERTGVSPDTTQSRLFDLALGLVTRLAARAPTVLIVDDIQWADRSTLDLLAFLSRNVRTARFMLVTTLRSDELESRSNVLPLVAELSRQPRSERIDLDRLTRREVADQLAGILGHTAAPALVDRVYNLSQGNAFFVEELLAAGVSGSSVPQTLRDVAAARTGVLDRHAAELLRLASAAGRSFSESVLSSVAEIEDAIFRGALHDLVDHQLLVRTVGTAGELFMFRHVLIQELAYGDLLPSERARVHAACARSLEDTLSQSGPDPTLAAELAYHWQATDNLEKALRASIIAGLAAQRTGARKEASEQFRRAIALLESMPTPPADLPLDHIELLERAAASTIDEPMRALAYVGEAVDLAEGAGDAIRAGELRAARGRYFWIAGDSVAAMSECRAAVELVPAHPPSVARARVTAGLGQILNIMGRSDEAVPFCQEAARIAAATGARAIERHALNTLGSATAYLGDIDGGLDLLGQALAIAQAIDNRDEIDRANQNRVDVLVFLAARFDDGAKVGLTALDDGPSDRVTSVYAAMILGHIALAYILDGHWNAAESILERIQVQETSGVGEIVRLVRAAQLHVGRGQFAAVERTLETLERLLEASTDNQWIAPATQARAELELWNGNPDRALETLATGLARLRPVIGEVLHIAPLHALGVRAAADPGQRRNRRGQTEPAGRAEGTAHLQSLRNLRQRIAADAPTHLRLADPYLALAEAESSRLDRRPDPDAWHRAADLLESVPLPYPAAYARWREAQALLTDRMDAARARIALRQAHEVARSLGAEPLRSATEDLAIRGRIDLTAIPEERRRADRPAGLSQREQEVLKLVAAGYTNRQIGERLFITEKTTSHHVSNILAKLGVADRAAAAAAAIRLRIVPLEDVT